MRPGCRTGRGGDEATRERGRRVEQKTTRTSRRTPCTPCNPPPRPPARGAHTRAAGPRLRVRGGDRSAQAGTAVRHAPPPPLPPVLTGHVSSLPPVLTGHVSSLPGTRDRSVQAGTAVRRAPAGPQRSAGPHGRRSARAGGADARRGGGGGRVMSLREEIAREWLEDLALIEQVPPPLHPPPHPPPLLFPLPCVLREPDPPPPPPPTHRAGPSARCAAPAARRPRALTRRGARGQENDEVWRAFFEKVRENGEDAAAHLQIPAFQHDVTDANCGTGYRGGSYDLLKRLSTFRASQALLRSFSSSSRHRAPPRAPAGSRRGLARALTPARRAARRAR